MKNTIALFLVALFLSAASIMTSLNMANLREANEVLTESVAALQREVDEVTSGTMHGFSNVQAQFTQEFEKHDFLLEDMQAQINTLSSYLAPTYCSPGY